ncbi:Low-density lipoprotein receptor-related protein 8 [Holothuria leucospilota]|uniref:Low-density lipoprotein receptor-related protein 8 n=1 Tax=Holothuria leucospilota TaxID=206669 RepID=A0A9Q1H7E9_HOLLE|nr:Low-density lipoprotein receptor-related protein 8 [Holothuria leucospilota]
MSKTIACELLMLAAALLQPWMVLSQGDNSCNAEVRATTSPQNIVSENFPNHYPNDINCRTHITSPEGTVIELHFYVFSLEDSTDCEKDALVVFDGIDGGTRLLQHSCGSDFVWPHYPDKVVSTGNGMTLEFITDASGTSIGFSATYQADPIGLRVDVVSRLLYWTDAIQNTVSVSDLDGNYRLTIIENAGLSRPGSIVNEPNRGYIYFTDQGSRGKIWKAEADGSNLRTLVNKTNFQPQGLAIDLQERCLYWVDTITSELQMITVDGSNSSSFRLYDGVDPFAIALDEAAIFFTDESLRFYERSLQMDGRGIVFVDVSDYRGLTLRPLYDFGEDDPYACSSSPCEEICLPKPSDLFICQKVMPEFVKICPDDLIINGTSSVSVTWNEPAVTSPRGLSVTHTQTHHPGENFDPGAHLVNYDFEDIVGNKVSCAFYVVVIEPLGIFCPDDVEVFVDEDDDHGIATWHEPVNSFGERAVTQTHTPGESFPLGQTTVNYKFEDSTYFCTFTVTITQCMF